MCSSATRIPAVVSAVNAAGIRIEGPVEQFTAPVRAVAPADLPDQIGCPVLVAVKAHHTRGGRGAAGRAAGRRRLRRVAAERAHRAGAGRRRRTGPGRARPWSTSARTCIEPGVVLRGNRATFMIGELDGTAQRPGVGASRPTSPMRRRRPSILGYTWAKEAYGATLVRHRGQRPADPRSVRRPRLPPAADRGRRRGARSGAGPGPAAGRLRPGRPGGLAGPAGRVQPAVGQDALGHLPGPGDRAPQDRGRRDPRPARRLPAAPDRGSDPRRSSAASAPAREQTSTCSPPSSGWTGWAGR